MDRRERWKLATHLNVYQIALLMAGYDPAEYMSKDPENWSYELKQDTGPFLTAIMNAVHENKIVATFEYVQGGLTWSDTRIDLDSFRSWLSSRNFRDDFFSPEGTPVDPVLDAESEFYAPKLAAAVRAWREVTPNPKPWRASRRRKHLKFGLRRMARNTVCWTTKAIRSNKR